MRGAWLSRGAVGLVLLFGGPSVCLADEYDRQLETAVMKIVAAKVGNIRGSLDREWTPPPVSDNAEPATVRDKPAAKPDASFSTGSFVTIDPPAIALYVTTLASDLLVPFQEALAPMLAPPPRRQVRVIPLYH